MKTSFVVPTETKIENAVVNLYDIFMCIHTTLDKWKSFSYWILNLKAVVGVQHGRHKVSSSCSLERIFIFELSHVVQQVNWIKISLDVTVRTVDLHSFYSFSLMFPVSPFDLPKNRLWFRYSQLQGYSEFEMFIYLSNLFNEKFE